MLLSSFPAITDFWWFWCCMVLLLMFVALSIYHHIAAKQLNEEYDRLLNEQKNGNHLPENLKAWLTELDSARQLVQQERDILPKRKRDELDRQIYDKMLNYTVFSAFRHKVDSKLNGFSTRMEQRFPALTEKDLTLLYLILLKIPNDDILLLTNYAPSSLPTTKQRLAKKLGITRVNDLFPTLVSWV